MNPNYLSSAERRAYAVLAAYGSKPAAWPEAERESIRECVARSPALQRYQSQHEELDACIDSAQAAALPANSELHVLQQRILASLPAQATAGSKLAPVPGWMRIASWLITPRHSLALVAIMALAVFLNLHHSPSLMTSDSGGASSYAAWSWYDITGQELPAKQATSSLTMSDLINLELDQDGG